MLCRQTGRYAYVALWEGVSAGIWLPLPSSLSSCINSYVAVARRSGTWKEFYCLLDFCLVHIQMVGWVFSLSLYCSLWQRQAALLSLLLNDRLTVSSFEPFSIKYLYRVPVFPDSETFAYKNLTPGSYGTFLVLVPHLVALAWYFLFFNSFWKLGNLSLLSNGTWDTKTSNINNSDKFFFFFFSAEACE